jgi:xanthine dehydrogenase accessory factor
MDERALDGWEVIEKAGELARHGDEFALATVVWRQAPSSGQQGSRAIITAGGELFGWIGGACAEPVVVREAQRVIRERVARLLLLGTSEQFGDALPDGMTVIPIACQSEGALEIYVEPVVPTVKLMVVGRSPMAHALAEMAGSLGWQSQVVDGREFLTVPVDARTIVVVATQGHGDEEAVEHAVTAAPAFVGLVASHRRGEAVLGYLEDRGMPRDQLDRVHVPVGLDLGHTSHREIAVSILAELVQLRAAGAIGSAGASAMDTASAGSAGTESAGTESAGTESAGTESAGTAGPALAAEAVDPVCGMTVAADAGNHPFEHEGVTYYFCCVGCHTRFRKDPSAYLTAPPVGQEA